MTAREAFYTQLMAIAAQGESINDTAFTDCCYRAVSEFGFAPATLRETLDIGPASFERWLAGVNLPHPIMRGKILLAIAHNIKNP